MKLIWVLLLLMTTTDTIFAQANRIDITRPDAPELAFAGEKTIGVRTLDLVDIGRIDVMRTVAGSPNAQYDRPIRVEVWYPSEASADSQAGGQYLTETRNLTVDAVLQGRAVRDATPEQGAQPYPLLIVSHGFPGNRYLLSHLAENLATKGYVVVSIDHTDSTYKAERSFPSTLYNRAPDQRFVLNEMARLNQDETSFLFGLVDSDSTALIGFSMGGYGALNNLGAAYNPEMIDGAGAPPNQLLREWTLDNPDFQQVLDPRIRAGVAIAPWGMNTGYFNADSAMGINKPTLYVAGSMDRTAGYTNGPRGIFENAQNSDRYLLTFENGSHSVAAPMPVPMEIMATLDRDGAGHYLDPVWDSVRSNNILAHFVTAFVDLNLKGIAQRQEYLDVIPIANEAHYSIRDGVPTERHTYWKGFDIGTAIGMRFEHLKVGE